MFEADVVCYDKAISNSFPMIKRKRLTLMLTPYCQKRRSSFSLEFVLLSEKYPWSSWEEVWVSGIKLTISVCYRIFLPIDRCSEIILATAKNKFRIICIEVTLCPVCRLCIFRLSLSFKDFISSISERLTAVPKFHNFFLSRFRSDFASISYHLIIA